MIEVRLGFPEWFPGKGIVSIPPKEMGDVLDIGSTTAHELGHMVMGHRFSSGGRAHMLRELEAWVWAVSRRGLTSEDKDYFWDEIVQDAEDCGIDRSELVLLLKQAEKNVLRRLDRR